MRGREEGIKEGQCADLSRARRSRAREDGLGRQRDPTLQREVLAGGVGIVDKSGECRVFCYCCLPSHLLLVVVGVFSACACVCVIGNLGFLESPRLRCFC
uniref:Predicted protein n=1 Tax=Hordeum vulgare subsp. vulgare TaxID=112509 RepID=F2EBE2_HORVV|nr:predicted protein [Hordeum vulgare subsp. vulgare]